MGGYAKLAELLNRHGNDQLAPIAVFAQYVMGHIDRELEQLEDHIAGMDSLFAEGLRRREAATTGNPSIRPDLALH